MQLAPIPENEKERQETLNSYHIQYTLPEKDFDDIVRIASEICHTPIANISIIDGEIQWLKSEIGIGDDRTNRDTSFCGHTIVTPGDMMIVPDSRKDERFHDNPFVTGEPHIQFYAGVPLRAENGLALGTLCVSDTKPRDLDEHQLESLKSLASQVVAQLELRKKIKELELSRFSLQEINAELEKFAHVVAHDLKSPCNNFIGLSEILLQTSGEQLSEENKEIVNYISDSARQMKTLIDDILKYSQTLNFSQSVNDFTFEQLLHELNAMIHMPDNFELNQKGPNVSISAPKAALLQILSNLINNAIRYNDKETGKVSILFDDEGDHFLFSVTDNGQGIKEEDFEKIFEQNYTSLGDKKDRFNTLGQGIGLSTVKRLINKLGGDIKVSSKLGEGSTFHFTIAKQL